MTIEYKILQAGDEAVLASVAPDLFDDEVQQSLTREFLADTRHHLVVAIDSGVVVGFTSAVHYVHPDKVQELWINEVGVADSHRQLGIGKELLQRMFDVGRGLGCNQAWVLTDRLNTAAMRLYAAVGGNPGAHEHVMFDFQLRPAPPESESG